MYSIGSGSAREPIGILHGRSYHNGEQRERRFLAGLIAGPARAYNGPMSQDHDALLRVTDSGLYCERGGFYIDPWRPVDRAVVTHAHADHLTWGCGEYLVARDGLGVARARLGEPASIATAGYGEPLDMGGVMVSLHPAGHILGSAQVRLEHAGRVWVASGDYKVEPDETCAVFEPIRCHVFISECTFGLPIYRWRPQARDLRGHRRVVAGQPRRGPLERAVCLRSGQGAAGARRAGRGRRGRPARPHLHPRRRRGDEPCLSRCRGRVARDNPCGRGGARSRTGRPR